MAVLLTALWRTYRESNARMRTNLILVGGIFHDFNASAEALAELLAPLDITSRIEPDIEVGLASLARQPVDLLTINALRWEMLGDKYDPYRDTEALCLSAGARAAVCRHLADGGALLGLHTASICFSDWPEWQTILGGRWEWGQSWHPAPERIQLTPTDCALMSGLNDFEVVDEMYSDLTVNSDVEILLLGRSASSTSDQPALWRHTYGNARVVYDALGHDRASLADLGHGEALRRAVSWALDLTGKNV